VTGCSKVSPGCAHCYAETFAHRQMGQWKGRVFGDVRCHPDRLQVPLHWRAPRRVFVNSMSDLFHEAVPELFLDDVFAVMALAYKHTFQLLTKRPGRMRKYLSARVGPRVIGRAWEMLGHKPLDKYEHGGITNRPWPLPNVWCGVSVEDQATANERIPLLLQTPAAIRFVSAEPLLGPIDLNTIDTTSDTDPGYSALELRDDDEGDLVETLDWVIVGGESGPKARPCHVAWIQSLIGQCQNAQVPVFVKQLGADPRWTGADSPPIAPARGKCGDPAEWPEDLRVREFPR
jgi:protein gp37